MPLTKKDRTTLERQLKLHQGDVAAMREERDALAARADQREKGNWDDPNPKPEGIKGLRQQVKLLDRQVKQHEQLIALGRDDRVLAALGVLVDDPDQLREAAKDPRAFAGARGVKLPTTMDVVVRVVDDAPVLDVLNYDPLAPFHLVWDRGGFRVG